ncbi:CBS domain-containing protein [Pseudomonas aylmerensis]|uniref:Alcohol dehydrogenase n=1 Tax=Pseudomonas aylmerensis TaxID=1869229 RepID=A0A2T4FS67_9PSED|nr:nucleotidyltransferase family protein [Pseudomonas aylmerensis]OCW29301.1 alcohol dehydrogenase [Pseudomonas aylmerensis]PTC26237.1 CBS domain-containing protein [Pseudomonas aylmerensis]
MKQWELTLVGPECSMEEAIATLDRVAVRIVMIVDEERCLLGTLTDGDVRRALLKQKALSTQVKDVMCTTPRTAGPNWSRERIMAVMDTYQLLQLPVIDTEGKVIGLETLHELLTRRRRDNPVFLMAGGFGTRLRPLTHNCPKPLLKVGDKPILELILERFISSGFHRFFISTHYMPEMIREHFGDGSQWGVSIRYIHEDEPLGTGGALGLLPHDEIDAPLFLMNGDLLTTLNFENLLEFHQEHQGAATMCVREYEYCVPYGVIQSDGHRIRSMVEKPIQHFFINAGIYLLSPELVKSVAAKTRVDMPTLLEGEIAAGRDVNMFPVHEYWLDIGRMEDFQRAQQEFGGL